MATEYGSVSTAMETPQKHTGRNYVLNAVGFLFCMTILCLLFASTAAKNDSGIVISDMISYTDGIGGFYTDPNHYTNDGSFAGTRMVSDFNGITLIGSDDGIDFWTVKGTYTDEPNGKFVIDFSAKNGPEDLNAVYQDGVIVWEDGNTWTKSTISDLF